MRALIYNQTCSFDLSYPEPVAKPGEALVRVHQAGICNTDLEIMRGYMGFHGILGHEFVGVVQGGELDHQRVAGEINLACRQCEFCLRGMPTHCSNRTVAGIDRHNGAFADYLVLPIENLHVIPETITDEQAVFVEPLAAALQILHLTHISPHQHVVLLGAGKLGTLAAQVIALTGCQLTVLARSERQHNLLSRWGIETIRPGELTPRSADVVIDCTGDEDGLATALEIVKPCGEIHLKSTYHGPAQANLTRVVVDEIRITSSRCGPFPAAIRMLERQAVDVESLIEARYNLNDGVEAMTRAGQPGALKVILTMM